MTARLAALIGVAVVLAGPAAAACAPDRVDLRGPFGQVSFRVDVARTPDEQAQGLMFVEQMPRGEGMLFVYPSPRQVAFWMRNTLIPLDMVFIDARGTVVQIHREAIPGDETPIPSDGPVQYVLEINGGLAAQFGLAPGAEARHPDIAGDVVWPCAD